MSQQLLLCHTGVIKSGLMDATQTKAAYSGDYVAVTWCNTYKSLVQISGCHNWMLDALLTICSLTYKPSYGVLQEHAACFVLVLAS